MRCGPHFLLFKTNFFIKKLQKKEKLSKNHKKLELFKKHMQKRLTTVGGGK